MATARWLCNLVLLAGVAAAIAWAAATQAPRELRACREARRVRRAEAALARGDQVRAMQLLTQAGHRGEARLGQLLVERHSENQWPRLVGGLAAAGPQVGDAVAGVLQRSPEERLCAAEALAALGDPRGVAALASALAEPSLSAHPPADILAMGPPAVEALLNVVTRGPETGREPALMLLSQSASPRALTKLGELAADPHCGFRPLALRTLAAYRQPRVDDILRRALVDPDPAVRAEAVRQYGARRGTNALTEVTRGLSDHAPMVRAAAVDALSLARGPKAETALIGALDDPDPNIVGRAVFEVGRRRCRGAEQALARTYPRVPAPVREKIAGALTWMDSPLAPEYRKRWEKETGRRLELSSEWDG